jgi:hypothetical protein
MDTQHEPTTQDELTDDVQGHVGHHPIVTAELARQHTDELRADAARHRLAAQASRRPDSDPADERPAFRTILAALARRVRRGWRATA